MTQKQAGTRIRESPRFFARSRQSGRQLRRAGGGRSRRETYSLEVRQLCVGLCILSVDAICFFFLRILFWRRRWVRRNSMGRGKKREATEFLVGEKASPNRLHKQSRGTLGTMRLEASTWKCQYERVTSATLARRHCARPLFPHLLFIHAHASFP